MKTDCFRALIQKSPYWDLARRVLELLYDILGLESAVYVRPLGPKYLMHGYLDPVGYIHGPDSKNYQHHVEVHVI